MHDQFLNKRNIIIMTIAVLVIIVLLLPINIPFSVNITGKVMPGYQWLLARQTDGSIISTLYDYSQDRTDSYAAYQIERGDIFHFKTRPEIKEVTFVTAGDTIGHIFSNMFFQELRELEGALAVAKANLDVVSTGEKESIISEANDQFLLNRERSLVQNNILERQSKLYQDALISSEDFEITRGMTRIYELETQVAAAHLITLQTGEKPEIITQARTQIESIEKQLVILHNQLSEYTITTPLTGNINMVSSPDTLLLVSDDTRVVIMPILWQFMTEVDTSLSFTIQTPFDGEVWEGSIVNKSNFMRMIGGQQVFIATGKISDHLSDLPVNMLVQCSVTGATRSIWDYVRFFLEALV